MYTIVKFSKLRLRGDDLYNKIQIKLKKYQELFACYL